MAHLRLFASAREAAGKGRDTVPGATVREVLEEACGRYGHDFAGLLETCQVWCNGEPTAPNMPVGDDDEIAVLPPVSGGLNDQGERELIGSPSRRSVVIPALVRFAHGPLGPRPRPYGLNCPVYSLGL